MSDGAERYQADLRREGAADAVIRLVAAKTLLNAHVRADDVAAAVGLTRSDLSAALDRMRAGRTPARQRHWEVFDRRGCRGSRWTPIDDLVYEALGELGTAGPQQIQSYLRIKAEAVPYTTVVNSLLKQVNLGRLTKPAHGRYRRAA